MSRKHQNINVLVVFTHAIGSSISIIPLGWKSWGIFTFACATVVVTSHKINIT